MKEKVGNYFEKINKSQPVQNKPTYITTYQHN